jgi:hypothetical protein
VAINKLISYNFLYFIDIDIFVNCNWVDTRWQYTFTHKHPVAVHIYTQTIHRTSQLTTNKTTQTTNLEECWPCPVFASFTLAFVLQLREKHGKTSVRVAEEIQRMHIIKTPTHYKTQPYTHIHTHISRQSKTTTVQIKTNTVQDIPK